MASYTIGEAQKDGLLTLFPLLAAEPANDGGWLSLAEAVAAGLLEVTEVGDGVVGELTATNRAPSPVLILDGEQLIGAKQNRTTSRTILVAATSTTRIPVSCMEQGRWRHRTAAMATGEWHSPSKVRRHARRVEADASRAGETRADPASLLSMAQGSVWAEIRDSGARAGVHTATGALNEVYDGRRGSIEERAASFPRQPRQVGFAAFVGGSPLGVDVVADPATFERLHERLVRGYLFDALEREAAERSERAPSDAGPPEAARAAVEALLAEIGGSPRRPLPTAGLGEYRVLAGAVVGAELEWNGRVVHLSAFPGE